MMSETPETGDTQLSNEDQDFIAEVTRTLQESPSEPDAPNPDSQLDEMRAALQRVQADFVNYKRRSEQDREEMVRHLNAGLITRLLPVLDDLGMALDHMPEGAEGKAWADGVGLISRKLHTILESEGTSIFTPLGEQFDPVSYTHLTLPTKRIV